MSIIANEIPSWAIDGSNKVFTTAENIGEIIDLIVDWAEYYWFVVSWTTITLSDAPTLSIRVDYSTTAVIPMPWTDAITLWDVKTKIWEEMVQKSTSTTYSSTKLTNMVNEVSAQIFDKQVYNELTNRYIQLSDLPFNNKLTAYTIIDNPVLTSAIEAWDTEINVVTTDLDWSWTVMIWWDIITYNAKTATQLQWVSGILLPYDAWEEVIKLYPTPSDFNKPLKFYKMSSWNEVEVKWLRDWDSLTKYYNIVYSWDDTFIYTTSNISWWYYLKYTKDYTVLEEDTEEVELPRDIALNSLVFICAWRLIKDAELRVQLLTKWYGNLTVAANKYNNPSWKAKKPRWKRFSFSSIQ